MTSITKLKKEGYHAYQYRQFGSQINKVAAEVVEDGYHADVKVVDNYIMVKSKRESVSGILFANGYKGGYTDKNGKKLISKDGVIIGNYSAHEIIENIIKPNDLR